jgi:RNA polymerase sigma-70 factor, ECF subfamily
VTDDIRELVTRCLANEQVAMRELVERYTGQVFGLCLRMLGDRHDAEDLAQESFCRALSSLANWDADRDFSPWLLAIAGNRCRTWLAARSRRLAPMEWDDRMVDSRSSPEPDGLSEELEMALARLRPEYRQAFVLFHEQQFSYQEIAAALDCPLGTVKTWVHRARRELAQRLIDSGAMEPDAQSLRKV